MADKDKGKGIIIGDPQVLNENRKILSREVVAEKRWRKDIEDHHQIHLYWGGMLVGGQAKLLVLRITDGLAQ